MPRERSTKAWNDRKVTAHHAIIPTPNARGGSHPAELTPADRAVYELVSQRYLAQFNALDSLMAQLQSTSNYLTQQLANTAKIGNGSTG